MSIVCKFISVIFFLFLVLLSCNSKKVDKKITIEGDWVLKKENGTLINVKIKGIKFQILTEDENDFNLYRYTYELRGDSIYTYEVSSIKYSTHFQPTLKEAQNYKIEKLDEDSLVLSIGGLMFWHMVRK